MDTFICKRNPEQRYCSQKACQNARKRVWRKQKRASDADYRDNQRQANESWRAGHPDYWRRYRERHPEYKERNRQQQHERDQRRKASRATKGSPLLAKSDALPISTALNTLKSGRYRLIPVTRLDLAKSDALTVEISLITSN